MILHYLKFCTQYLILLPRNDKLTETNLQLRVAHLSLYVQIRGDGISSPRGTALIIHCALVQLSIHNQIINENLSSIPAYNKSKLLNRIDCGIQDASLLVFFLNLTENLVHN